MKEYAVVRELANGKSEHWEKVEQYYSVEISIDRLEVIYQFRIWDIESTTMFILVKENSDILPWLKVGDKVNMKYYSTDLLYPFQYLDTEIQNIIKQDQGRLKGHYLVGLEISESQDQDDIHWPYPIQLESVSPLQ